MTQELFADREREKVFLLAKVFCNKGYAEQFLEGKLYANRVFEFKRIEDDLTRGDAYEGGVMLDPDEHSMVIQAQDQETGELEEITLGGLDFGSSIKMKLSYFDNLNLFCMYGVRISDLDSIPANTQVIKKKLALSKNFHNFGKHAVVITDATQFINRVAVAAMQERYALEFDFVKYYDPEVGTLLIPQSIETLFTKRNELAWQKEFRFVLNTFTQGKQAVILDIGSISDIAFLGNTSDMINPSISILKNSGK